MSPLYPESVDAARLARLRALEADLAKAKVALREIRDGAPTKSKVEWYAEIAVATLKELDNA